MGMRGRPTQAEVKRAAQLAPKVKSKLGRKNSAKYNETVNKLAHAIYNTRSKNTLSSESYARDVVVNIAEGGAARNWSMDLVEKALAKV